MGRAFLFVWNPGYGGFLLHQLLPRRLENNKKHLLAKILPQLQPSKTQNLPTILINQDKQACDKNHSTYLLELITWLWHPWVWLGMEKTTSYSEEAWREIIDSFSNNRENSFSTFYQSSFTVRLEYLHAIC